MKILSSLLLCFSSSISYGSTVYMNVNEIFPAQLRYSSANVQEKVQKKIKKGYAVWNPIKDQWNYRFFNGQSIFDKNEAFPVVKTAFGYVLIDGHHDILASLELKAYWIPVKVVSDFSNLSEQDFWKEAEKQDMAYLYDIYGNKHIPPRLFTQLVDDPNRYFATITARKVSDEGEMSKSDGAEYPLWIKVGKDIPFIEFRIADVLWRNNIIYTYEMGKNPPEELVERARVALVAAHIPGLKVVVKRTRY